MWDYDDLRKLKLAASNPFIGLPGGAAMRVAARRSTRVGSRSGIPVEDYGVAPDARYFMTKRDVVDYNDDLIATAAAILKKRERQTLRLIADPKDPLKKLSVDCTSIDRVDLFVDDRPAVSLEVVTGGSPAPVVLPFAAKKGSVIRADGYRNNDLVVSTRLSAGA